MPCSTSISAARPCSHTETSAACHTGQSCASIAPHNPAKTSAFSVEERVEMLKDLVAPFSNVEVTSFHGLLVDFARHQNADCIIRGVRAFSDFEYEFQMALVNRKLAPDLETIFLMPKEKYSAVSSRLVREIGSMGGELKELVPDQVRERIMTRLTKG